MRYYFKGMSCLQLPTFPTYVKVIHWKSKTDFTEYEFNDLYIDDTVFATVCKILGQLHVTGEKMVPYVWSTEPLRFKILSNNWPGYNANPFFADTRIPVVLPEVQVLPDRIVEFAELNIVLYSDLVKSGLATLPMKYYFPAEKDTFTAKDITQYMYQNELLAKLKNTPEQSLRDMTERSVCSFVRVIVSSEIHSTNGYRELFERLHTGDLLSFIQFYDDVNHIYYKTPTNHTIPEPLFLEWTDPEKFKHMHSITAYAFLKNKDSYAKVFLDDTKKLRIMYYIQEHVSYDTVLSHMTKLKNYLEQRWQTEILLNTERLAMKTQIQVKDLDFKKFAAYLFKQTPLFDKSPYKNRLTKNILDVQYKRVARYGQSLDLVELIKSKLQFDTHLSEIIEELSQYGIEEELVREYIEQIQREEELPKIKKQFKNVGLLLQIHPVALHLQVYIDNASSLSEIQHVLYWLRCAVYHFKTISPSKPVVPKKQKVSSSSSEEEVVVRKEAEVESKASSELSLGGAESLTAQASAFGGAVSLTAQCSSGGAVGLREAQASAKGGAVGKKHQRYFKNMLEKLDPDIFAKSDNYARKCQVSDMRQPVGMTLAQKEKIDQQGYADGYDNFIMYGSDPAKPNVYMCPKIFCPVSQIPLSYEKYQALGEKCPDPNEEAILMYTTTSWYNDPLRKHYVGFLKEKGYNNLGLPCCFKTPPDKKQSEQPTEDAYIIDRIKQIEPGRYGTLPSSLHDFLYPNIPYSLCRNTVKGDVCLLRRGIVQSNDSLMESIAYLLGFDNKAALVEHIYKTLDPLTFLTLEQGMLYPYFLSEKSSGEELEPWFKKFPKYVSTFQLHNLTKSQKERLQRICTSYYNYLRYLKHDSVKNPYLLFDLVKHLGAALVVWNRDSQNIATLRCPFAYEPNEQVPYVLVMQQEDYYEPLVLVDPTKQITRKIAFSDKLKSLLQQCPTYMPYEEEKRHQLRTLALWIEHMLEHSSAYAFATWVIDGQDNCIGLFLKNNTFIKFGIPITLATLHNMTKRIAYWEDIQGKIYEVTNHTSDLKLLKQKLKQLNFGYDIGHITHETGGSIKSLYTVPPIYYHTPPKIQLKRTMRLASSTRWHSLKKSILQKLLKEPALIRKSVTALEDVFSYMNDPIRVKTILEELTYDTAWLKKEYHNLKSSTIDLTQATLSANKKEWVFTQQDIYTDTIKQIMNPLTIQRPATIQPEQITNVRPLAFEQIAPDISKQTDTKPLPSKWRSKFWLEQRIQMPKKYTQDMFYQLLEWLAGQQRIVFDRFDMEAYLKKEIEKRRFDVLLEDMSVKKAFVGLYGKNALAVLTRMNDDDVKKVWADMVGSVWPGDLHLYMASRLLQVSFFIIHKGKDVYASRGNLDELVAASDFIHAPNYHWESHPVLLLFKYANEEKTHYQYATLENGFYRSGSVLPGEVRSVVFRHLGDQPVE